MLEDIATLTGGKAVTEDLGIKLENVKMEDLGRAKKVVIDKDNTTIVEGGGKSSEIEGRVKQIRQQIENTPLTTTRKSSRSALPSWLAALRSSRWAQQPKRAEGKKARVEDAMHATRAAVEEGIVAAAAPRYSVASLQSRSSSCMMTKQLASAS